MLHQDSASTWLSLKTLRLLALLALICITIWQCVQNIQEYIKHEAVTTVSKEKYDSIDFPQVTICNYNRWRMSQLTPEEIGVALEAYRRARGQDDGQEIFFNGISLNLYDFTYEKGWHLVDQYNNDSFTTHRPVTLLGCQFSGEHCSTKFLKHRMTSYGNCYTFNKDVTVSDVNDTNIALPLAQTHASETGGFSAYINVESDEYTENGATAGNVLLGLKVIVHSKDEQPDPATSGVSIGPGFYGTITLRRTEYNNLERPEGTCDSQRVLQYFEKYTLSSCEAECKINHVERNCSCRPYYYAESRNVCGPVATLGCSNRMIAAINRNFSKYCDCPEPCTYEDFSKSVAYAPFPNLNMGRYLVDNHGQDIPNISYLTKNYVGVKVYFDDLASTVITQSPAHTLVSTLNDIGGTSGLYIGFSFVTFVELAEVVADLIQTIWMKKKDSVENLHSSVPNIQKEAFK